MICDISDTGIGIKEEDIPYLFTAFSRADEENTHHIEGTGLGLSIVRQLIDLMGGTVSVTSEYGKGSNFHVEIPQQIASAAPAAVKSAGGSTAGQPADSSIARAAGSGHAAQTGVSSAGTTDEQTVNAAPAAVKSADGSTAGQPADSSIARAAGSVHTAQTGVSSAGGNTVQSAGNGYAAQAGVSADSSGYAAQMTVSADGSTARGQTSRTAGSAENRLAGVKVLAVDDTVMNLKVLRKLLRGTGAELDVAERGAEALQKTLTTHYDVILMDHQMPEMDGIECLGRIRTQENGLCKGSRIVCLTANAGPEMKGFYMDAGFDGYLEKPVRGAALVAELAKITDQR